MSDNTAGVCVFDTSGYTRVECVYFKDSGKFYTSATCYVKNEIIKKEIYPKAVGRFLRNSRGLPGLQGGVWDGAFTCRIAETEEPCNSGYMELVPAVAWGG